MLTTSRQFAFARLHSELGVLGGRSFFLRQPHTPSVLGGGGAFLVVLFAIGLGGSTAL